MTDKELLKAAAKAARLRIDTSEFNGGGRGNTGFDLSGNAVLDWHNDKKWNPSTNDGDAMRLLHKIAPQLTIEQLQYLDYALTHLDLKNYRKAIVLVAANLGGAE